MRHPIYNHRIVTSGIKEDISAICKQTKKDAEYCEELRQTVKKYDQRYQVFAAWLLARNVEPDSYVEAIQKYVDSKKITNFSVSKNAVKINNEVFAEPITDETVNIDPDDDTALRLTEYIHAKFPILQAEKKIDNYGTEDVPVVANEDNSIRIFEINDANDGRRLVGNDTSWCIGYKGPNNMWQAYRDRQISSFFVVFDDNPPTPNQRKVAIDFTAGKILLTDIPNHTGFKLSNGWDWEKYSDYLTSKGINLKATRQNPKTGEEELILKNKPKTKEELIQNSTFRLIMQLDVKDILLWQSGKSIINPEDGFLHELDETTLDIAEKISDVSGIRYIINNPDAKFYTSRWMGVGNRVKNEVLEYLSKSVGGEDLLMKYVNTGMELSEEQYQFFRQNKNLVTTYLRNQIIVGRILNATELNDLISLNRKDLFKQYVEKKGSLHNKSAFENNLEYVKIYIETLVESGNLHSSDEKLLIILNDRKIIKDYLSNVKLPIGHDMQKFITNDPELLFIYSKNKLTVSETPVGRNFSVKLMRNSILESGDKSLIKQVALATGFGYNDFIKAKELGVLEEVKYSILCPVYYDRSIVVFYDSDNPFDVSLIQQIENVDILRNFLDNSDDLMDGWSKDPTINFANDLADHSQLIKKEAHYAYQDQPEELITKNPNQTLLWAIYNDGELFNQFEKIEMDEETKENFRNSIQEFQIAIQDINFWKNFFKHLDKFSKWISSNLNFSKNDWGNILNFIPQQFLEDPEIKEFLRRKIVNISSKYFINNLDIEKTPWLFEDYINQFIKDSETRSEGKAIYDEFLRIISTNNLTFGFEFLSKILEKKKLSWEQIWWFKDLKKELVLEFLDLYTHYYPEDKEKSTFYFSPLFWIFDKDSTLNEQLHLLRNYPKYFEVAVLQGDNYVHIKPEIRAALAHMYPDLAPNIIAYEKKAKYGTGYFDEESGEVIMGKRPLAPGEEELPDPFAPDEDENITAFVKSMVKLANRLDFKKKYKLADKFTNILRKYNV